MTKPVNVLGKYGMGPWGYYWKSIWYIKPNNWTWWNWWSWWVEYKFSDNAYWIWNIPNAQNNAPVNVPIIFTYTYYNNTGKDINALLYHINDDEGKFYINNKPLIENWNYGRQRLPCFLKKGKNVIEAVCYNYGGPAGFIADVRDIKTEQVLFSTNGDWKYDTNYTNKLFNQSFCYNKSANGYVNVDNVGFGIDLKNDEKTFEDGDYLLLSRQSVRNNKYYPKQVSMTHKLNENDPSNQNYMNGTLLNESFKINGKYTFKIVWKGSGFQEQIWKQSSDPFRTKKVEGYEWVNAPYNQNYWNGLRFNGKTCVLSGSNRPGWWYYAIGSFNKWSSGIPGPYGAVQSVELYVLKSKVGNYNNLGHVWISGNNLSYHPNTPFDKCAQKCDETDNCKAFSQELWQGKGCVLKTNDNNTYGPTWWAKSYSKDLQNPNKKDLINPNNSSYKPVGGYNDWGWVERALPNYLGASWNTNASTCSDLSTERGYKYFGLQYPQGGTECWAGNDLRRAKQYGRVNTTKKGGPWANYVYENINKTKAKKDLSERGCIDECNKLPECVGYSFDKSNINNNCNMYKKLPKYYHKNSSKKIAFKSNNIGDFNNLSNEEKIEIKKKCGSTFLSKKFNVDEDVIEKCISLKGNSKTTGFDVDPGCLYKNLEENSSLRKNNITNTGFKNSGIDGSNGNFNIDQNIKKYTDYTSKESEFANENNKRILNEPSNQLEHTNEVEKIYKSGEMPSYINDAKELTNQIENKIKGNNIENFSNFEESYLDNIKYTQRKWYFIGILILLFIILLYYFKF